VRSRGRKVFSYGRNVHKENPPSILPAAQPAESGSGTQSKPQFEFTYSERYNLKRLPKEEAADERIHPGSHPGELQALPNFLID